MWNLIASAMPMIHIILDLDAQKVRDYSNPIAYCSLG